MQSLKDLRGHSRITILYTVLALTTAFMAACGHSSNKGGQNEASRTVNNIKIDTALRSRLEKFAAAPRVEGKFAFYVYDLTADKPVLGVNENMALPSASCMKLLSGVAGFHLMGTGYKYTTSMYMKGSVSDGTLMGDATFKGSLDPQFMPTDMRDFAKALRSQGVTKLGGRMIVDLEVTEPVRSEPHWYPWDLTFSKYGIFYKGSQRVMRELKYALRAQGIQLRDSQMVLGRLPQGSRKIFEKKSPISLVTQRMWKNSSNTQATAMLYTIGRQVNKHGTPTYWGVWYLRKFMRENLGLTDSTLVIHDGCGLCTYNRLSPKALVLTLRYAYQRKNIYNLLYNQLSVAGTDGTLARMMTNHKTRGKIRAKTGTLSHPYGISSLAGYCKGSDGHQLAFAIMDSEMSVLDARVYQRKLCEALVKE